MIQQILKKRALSTAALTVAALLAGCGLITMSVSLPEAFTHNGDLGLKGSIADDQGAPVDQVVVHIDRTYYLWHASSSYNEYSTLLRAADHDFTIPPMRAHELKFTFKKTGYDDASLIVDQDNNISTSDPSPVRGSKWPTQEVKIILPRADRVAAELNVVDASIDLTDPAQFPVINLSHPLDKLLPSSTRVNIQSAAVENVDPSKKPLPAGMFFADVERQPLKTIGPDKQVDPLDVNLPGKITLRFSDADAGFIPYTPGPGSPVLDQMGQAPESGYYNELTMDAPRLRKLRDHNDELVLDRNVFFYFRAGGKFGKAIGSWGAEKDDHIRLSFVFYIQPDGTRNLVGHGTK